MKSFILIICLIVILQSKLIAVCYNYSYALSFNPSTNKEGSKSDDSLSLSITISAFENSNIEIIIPHLNFKEIFNLKKGESKKFNFNYNQFNLEMYQQNISEPIFINSEKELFIIISHDDFWITDAEKVSNKCSFGKHFIANMYFNYDYINVNRKNIQHLKIIAQEDNTETIVKTSKNSDYFGQLKVDKNYHLRLEKGDSRTFYFNADFSGLEVFSNRNIIVATSASYMNLPKDNPKLVLEDYGLADHLYTNMIPSKYLGNEYVLTPFKSTKPSYHYKVVSLEDNNKVNINDKFVGIYNKGEFFQGISDSVMIIKGDYKISVTQYGNYFSIGDPCMLQNIPLNQKSKLVQFVSYNSPSNLGRPSNISILKVKNDDIYLDNNQINLQFNEIPNSNYEYLDILVDEGYHEIKSSEGTIVLCYSGNRAEGICYLANNRLISDEYEVEIKLNKNLGKDFICYESPIALSADAPEEAVEFYWTINDTLKVTGKEVNLDLPKPGKYNIKLKIDNDDSQVYEWTTTRLEEIKSDLDSVIYLCNDSLNNISMNVSGGGTSKSITWFPSENIKDPTQFYIEFIKPLKESTKLFYEVIDEHCCTYLDSVDIQITNIYPIITTTQNNFCYGDSTTLSLDKDYDTIIWNTGESTKDIIVKESGVYSATVTQGECTNETNILINVNPLPTLDIEAPKGTILCDGGSIILEAKVPQNTSIVWNDGTRLVKRTFSKSGTYTLTAEDIKTGCKNTKSIIVSDIENLNAEIQGDPTFCDGERTTLTIQPQGKSYLWNTGETTQSIIVNNSGLYSATITTNTDCKIDAEIEVIKNPIPTFQILGETIICNNSTTIYPDKDFEFYQWSNGKTSKSITINKAGNYDLTVTDDNGCKTTQSIEITESTPEINLSNRNIDFGELLFGDTKLENIITDRDILIIKNSSIFDVNFQNKNINISFNPKDIGEFNDTLIIESTGDCKALDTIYIKGICKAEILAKVSNSEGYPGDLVNNTVNLELLQNIPLPKDFNYEIDIQINQDAISVIDATTFNYKNNNLEINIADYINKTQYDEEIDKVESKILLAKSKDNDLMITKFETDNPYLIPIRQNGNIKIFEVCLYEERLIQHYNEAIISNITQTNTRLTSYYIGKYTIDITDISGKTTTKEVTTTSDNEEINFNYKLSNGTYIIKISEPGKTQTRKIIFGE